MHDLTPRQMKWLDLIYKGPWPHGAAELMDDDFNVLRERKLIVCHDDHRGVRVYITAAGQAIIDKART